MFELLQRDWRIFSLAKRKWCYVSIDDYEWLSRWKWYLSAKGYPKRTLRNGPPYAVFMHKAIVCAPKNQMVDHVNRNKLDNRRSNLRLCNASENSANAGHAPGVSGYRGVSRSISKTSPWQASIYRSGKPIHIGVFSCPIEAAKARDRVAQALHGEFAILNFPDTERVDL